MNLKNLIPLIAAVLLGTIALFVARKALNKSATGEGATPVVGVVVASRDLPPGRELTADDLSVTRMPVESLPTGSFRSVQELANRTTLQPLVKGQAVVEPTLAPTGSRGGLMALIPEGYRAMTVEVNEFSGLAGMLQPGARVDVVASLRDEKGQQSARTILQNLEVRAIGRNINPAPAVDGATPPLASNNVTLLVTPRQAQILNLSTQQGRPWLVLRNNLDKQTPDSELITLAELIGAQPRENKPEPAPVAAAPATRPAVPAADIFAPAPARPAARVVQVIRGGVESTVKFEDVATSADQSRPAVPATRPGQTPGFGHDRAVTDAGTETVTD